MVVHAYNTSTWETETGGLYFKVRWAIEWDFALPQRNFKEKKFTFRLRNCWESLTETSKDKKGWVITYTKSWGAGRIWVATSVIDWADIQGRALSPITAETWPKHTEGEKQCQELLGD